MATGTARRPAGRADAQLRVVGKREILLLGVHVPLALAMSQSPALATAHALGTLFVGLLCAVRGPVHRVAYVTAYMTGAEVLWRMTDGSIVYEYTKYAVSLVLITAIVVRHLRLRMAPMTYFLLLLPSALYTVGETSIMRARPLLSFNLSGPLSLTLSVIFFAGLRIGGTQLVRLVLCVLYPIVSTATVTAYATLTAKQIRFTGESNWVTSGGYGPNQVSSILGLGAMLALLFGVNARLPRSVRWLSVGIAMILAAQSAMTFSRSGIAMAAMSIAAAGFFLLRLRKSRATLIGVACVTAMVALLYVVPKLNDFTGGALGRRFSSQGMTHREGLMRADLAIFAENALAGVGPGMAFRLRGNYAVAGVAHTEYTRMLAEHGLLGLAALFVLACMSAWFVYRARGAKRKAFVTACVSWTSLYLLVNAMRLTAPSFLFGLAATKSWAIRQEDLD